MGLGQGWDTDSAMDTDTSTNKDTDRTLQGRRQGPGEDTDVASPPGGSDFLLFNSSNDKSTSTYIYILDAYSVDGSTRFHSIL